MNVNTGGYSYHGKSVKASQSGFSQNAEAELAGTNEEQRNWKGLIIALVIILSMIGIITTAIVFVLPENEKYDPGEPLTLSHITDDSLKLRKPIFSWVKGTEKYVIYKHGRHPQQYTNSCISLVDPLTGEERVIVPPANIADSFRNIDRVSSSADGEFILVAQNSIPDSSCVQSSYSIFQANPPEVLNVDPDNQRLQFASFYNSHQLVYVKNNNIYHRSDPKSASVKVTSDGSQTVLNGVPSLVYKKYIFPHLDCLIWFSADHRFVFAKITIQNQIFYSAGASSSVPLLQNQESTDLISLYVFNGLNIVKLNLPHNSGFVTSVVWISNDSIMVIHLSADHQKQQYLICNAVNGICQVNFEYRSLTLDLNWVGLYGDPVFNSMENEYYVILPDPSQKDKLYRHIAAIKVEPDKRHAPDMDFLTSHGWSDKRLLGLDGSVLYYMSTGSNWTHQHLYSLDVHTLESSCLTCNMTIKENATYLDAEFSSTMKHIVLSVLGPDIPSYYVVRTQLLIEGRAKGSVQLDMELYDRVNASLAGVHVPKTEFLTLALDDQTEASIKLILPPQFNRKKILLYNLLIILNENPGEQIATQEYKLSFNEYLAKNYSYIVALVDGRGSAGRGEVVQQSSYGRLGLAEGTDLFKIISFLSEHYETYKVNSSAVAVFGKGYGGFAALHAVSKPVLHCGIIESPILTIRNNSAWLSARYMKQETAAAELNYLCEDGSPSCSLPKSSSILIVHGTDDKIVPIENSLMLSRSLQLAGYAFKQQLYPGIGHDISLSDVKLHYYQTMVRYLTECYSGHHNHTSYI